MTTDAPDSLGVCDTRGPCDPMRDNLRSGGVVVYRGRLYLANGWLMQGCVWCQSRLALEPASIAAWPWPQLRPVKEEAA